MMNDPVIKLCIYRCSDYVFSCKQLPLILMKRKVLGREFPKKEAQKVIYFPCADWSLILAPSVVLEIRVYQNVQNCFASTQ